MDRINYNTTSGLQKVGTLFVGDTSAYGSNEPTRFSVQPPLNEGQLEALRELGAVIIYACDTDSNTTDFQLPVYDENPDERRLLDHLARTLRVAKLVPVCVEDTTQSLPDIHSGHACVL